ncbi:DeoR family transcriptional regulator [Candidatus Kuenenbacteria bacterium]|nr:DeoR family transcriptional regulator [Candidatus Kuenenbacteria bacterium]
MNERQKQLFLNILHEHINSGRAIGSNFLVDKYRMNVSSATIRNDMAELERQGYITHPHTSAGRIPTEKGYQCYLDNYLDKEVELNRGDKEALATAKSEEGNNIKNVAKKIAELSNAAVVVAFEKNNIYYTGISNLLTQPEFADFDLIYDLSFVVDHLDEVVEKIFDSVQETEIKIGKDNYFAKQCASILTKIDDKMLGILGPVRMDYQRNLGLINYTKKLLK